MSTVKDLTKEAPRSANVRLNNYVILARTIDKGRSMLENKIGEYNFDCPLDNLLFSFKEIKGDQLLEQIKSGAEDQKIAEWLDTAGKRYAQEEVKAWSDSMEKVNPFADPAKKEWYTGACKALGLDPATTTLFQFLDADDKASFTS